MGRILSKEQKEEFKDILETLGESLDITPTQYDNLTRSYKAVGEFLQNRDHLDWVPLSSQSILMMIWMLIWCIDLWRRIQSGHKKT